jgi:uncharacterized protein
VVAVARICIAPVKGTALHHPERIELGPEGVAENRLFYLTDTNGLLLNGKRAGPLVQLSCDYDPAAGTLSVATPRGRVSEEVRLIGEAVETNFYGRPVRGFVVGGALPAVFAEHVGAPVRLVKAAAPGGGVDVHPVTLIATATADHVQEQAGAPARHWRDRFRILFELDGLAPFEEEEWEGRKVAIGEAVVAVLDPVPRCAVTNQDPRSGDQDFDTLGALRRTRPRRDRSQGPGLLLGVYAVVERPGTVRRGDPVRVAA